MNIRKTVSVIAVTLVFGGIAAGCGAASQAPAQPKAPVTAPAPKTHEQQVREDLLAWKDRGGAEAMHKLVTDFSVIPESGAMTPEQISQMSADIDVAKTHPMPASIDPGGYYVKFLDHLETAMSALSDHDPITAMVETRGATVDMEHLNREIRSLVPQGVMA